MRTLIQFCFIALLPALFLPACKEEEDNIPEQEAFFSYQTNGFTVSFTNLSRLTGTYLWDFGDNNSSTEKNPVHAYPGKGKYVVTLYVTIEGKKAEASTVLLLDKTSPVKLDDGTLADWDMVTKNVYNSGPDGGAVKLGKFDYDANNIYFYLEIEATIADETIFSIFIDTDTSLTTGFQMGGFPGVGADLYCEGQVALTEPWLDPYTYNGDGSNWDWAYFQTNDYYRVGTFDESGNRLRYELALSRTKLEGLTSEAVRFVIVIMDSGWSDIGYMPDSGTSGFLLMMNE